MIMHYRRLAEYYDKLFSPFRQPLDDARDQVLGPLMCDVKSACDLGCGTGITALTFAHKKITTYAVDVSPTMCRLVRQKASRARRAISVIKADMRTFRLPERVDLITCEGDALNHVSNKADLRKVVRAAARALRPGGYFYFDVNNSLGFKSYWCGTVWLDKPGVAVLMRNGHNGEADRAWSDIDWFIRDGKCWRRYTERLEEVCWTEKEIRRALRESGFDRVRSWDAAPFWKDNPMITPGCRSIYLARKG